MAIHYFTTATITFGNASAIRAPKAESKPTGRVCPGCKAEERRQKNGAGATTMLHPESCRVMREAPLVALVNAVPDGLDPNAWRAAVLAFHDCNLMRPHPDADSVATFHRLDVTGLLRAVIEDARTMGWDRAVAAIHPDSIGYLQRDALAAYRRALTPPAKVAPERKTRGPVLVCDSGWEG